MLCLASEVLSPDAALATHALKAVWRCLTTVRMHMQGIATPRAHQVSRAGSASDVAGREKLHDGTWQGALSRGTTFNDMGEIHTPTRL